MPKGYWIARVDVRDAENYKDYVAASKIAFEKYFLHKMRAGTSEPFYEKLALQVLGIDKLKAIKLDDATPPI